MAERLFAQDKSESSRQLLATSYLSAGKPNKAYAVLEGCVSERNKYLAALCAYKLDKLKEAERVMVGDKPLWTVHDVPNGAAGLYLMGLICKKQNQKDQAVNCFVESLKINPFLWSSYETLAMMGKDMDPAEFFGSEATPEIQILPSDSPVPTSNFIQSNQLSTTTTLPTTVMPMASLGTAQSLGQLPEIGKTSAPPSTTLQKPLRQQSMQLSKTCISTPFLANKIVKRIYESTSPFGDSDDTAGFQLSLNPMYGVNLSKKYGEKSHLSPFVASKTIKAPIQEQSSRYGSSPPTSRSPQTNQQQPKKKHVSNRISDTNAPPQNKWYSNLFTSEKQSTSSSSTTAQRKSNRRTKTTTQPLLSDSTKTLDSNAHETDKINNENETKLLDGTVKVLTLLRTIGEAIRLLFQYRCTESIRAFKKLPENQYSTGWVLCNIGKAYYEMAQYLKSKKVFETVRNLEPYRTSGMEIYSTVLWQLNEHYALSYLAQQLEEIDKYSPASWCAVGNCFSLQKERETALKFFKRAIQLDPDFTYAHTLSGHEYLLTENWDKAMACFRTAIRLDPRHHNAWYGIGLLYNKQENYSAAEYHFRRALQINQRSSVLYCYIGMVLHQAKKPREALKMLENAIKIDPKNALAQYKKAAVLVSLGDLKTALSELEKLTDISPKESHVYFLMGKIYKKLDKIDEAMGCFTTALDFDTQRGPAIKAAIAKLGVADVDSEEEEIEDLK